MEIRLATSKDYRRIARALANKQINYITPKHAKEDIQKERLYVMVDGNKILAQCAIVLEPDHHYYAIKRLTVYNKKNCGQGIAQAFITFFRNTSFSLPLGCTPWSDNTKMKNLLSKNGFQYQYTFLDNYEFWKT